MLFLRSLAFNLGFYAFTTLVALACLPALATRRSVLGVARLWARGTIWLLRVAAGIRVEFRGLEHIPSGGGGGASRARPWRSARSSRNSPTS